MQKECKVDFIVWFSEKWYKLIKLSHIKQGKHAIIHSDCWHLLKSKPNSERRGFSLDDKNDDNQSFPIYIYGFI